MHACVAIDFQRDVLERNFQIERENGCIYMANIPRRFPMDLDLNQGTSDFMMASMACYTKCLKRRKDRYLTDKLRTDGKLSRMNILEFLEGCNAVLALEETKAELRALYLQTGSPPNVRCIELQHEVLELLGVEKNYACRCLNDIQTDFANDQEVLTKMQYFMMRAKFSVDEAMMSDVNREAFYRECPTIMHTVPHIFIMQKQREQQQHQMRMQHMQATSPEYRALQALLTSTEGQEKAARLEAMLQLSKEKMEAEVKELSPSMKADFVKDFSKYDLVLQVGSNNGDVSASMQLLLNMTEADVDTIVKLQVILTDDVRSGGNVIKDLMHQKEEGNAEATLLFETLGLLKQVFSNKVTMKQQQQHAHDPNCNHCQPTTTNASKLAEKMDR